MNEKKECKPSGIEHVDLLIKIPNDKRGVISGKVVDEKSCPIKDAVVGLFELVGDKRVPETCKTVAAAFCFTDCSGEFVFGPICPDKDYRVKAWKNITKTKCEKLEIKAEHECLKGIDCDKKCDRKDEHKKPCKPSYEPEYGGYGD